MNKDVQFKQPDQYFVANAISALLRYRILIGSLILITTTAILFEHYRNPRYKISSRLHIQNIQDSPIQTMSAKLAGYSGNFGSVDYPDKYLKLLRTNRFFTMVGKAVKESEDYRRFRNFFPSSRSILRNISFHKKDSSNKHYSDQEVGSQIAQWVSFKKSDYDTISVDGVMPDRYLATKIVNITSNVALAAINAYEIKELDEAEYYLQLELDRSKERISEIDDIITDYKKQSKRVSLNLSRGGDSSTESSDIKKDIDQAEIEMRHNKILIAELEKFKREQINKLDEASREPSSLYKGGIASRIENLELENDFLASKKTALREKLEEIINSKDLHYEQKIFDFKRQIELEYSLYQTLKREIFQTGIQRISVKNRVRLFDEATIEQVRPAMSLSKKLVIALLLSLTIVGVLIYGWEYFFPRIQNRFDLERLGLTFLGKVPNLNRGAHPLNRMNISDDPKVASMVCRFTTDSIAATSFRYLRTKLVNITELKKEGSGNKTNVVAIISASTGDGKSVIAANLSMCVAHMNKRVLLIDCDFRKASQSRFFHLGNSSGLSEVLRGQKMFSEVVGKNVFPNLDVLSAGKKVTNAAELLSTERFAQLIQGLHQQYDMVILDTPAFDAGPEAIIAAKLAGLPIIVSYVNKTGIERVMNVVEGLATVDFDRVYAILNGDEQFANNYIYAMPYGASGMFKDGKSNSR